MQTRTLIMAAVAALTTLSAGQAVHAQTENEASGYLSIRGGASFLGDSENITASDLGISNDIDFDTGYNGNIALGVRSEADALFGVAETRGEVELGYWAADVDSMSGNVAGAPFDGSLDGDLDSINLMANVFADVPVNEVTKVYIGAGLGAARMSADSRDPAPASPLIIGIDDEDTVFAYQFMTGLSFKLDKTTSIQAGYRLWNSADPEFNNNEFDSPLIHTVELGLTFDF